MSAFKDNTVYITMACKEYPIAMNLNALDTIQDKYGDLEALNDNLNGKENFKAIKFLLSVLIEEGSDGEIVLTEKEVGRLLQLHELEYIVGKIQECFNIAIYGQAVAPQLQEAEEPKNELTATA